MKVRIVAGDDIGQVREVDNDEARALLDSGDAEPYVEREIDQAEQRPEGHAAERRVNAEPGSSDATVVDGQTVPDVAANTPPAPEPELPPAYEPDGSGVDLSTTNDDDAPDPPSLHVGDDEDAPKPKPSPAKKKSGKPAKG